MVSSKIFVVILVVLVRNSRLLLFITQKETGYHPVFRELDEFESLL